MSKEDYKKQSDALSARSTSNFAARRKSRVRSKEGLDAYREELQIDDHVISLGDLTKRHKTDLDKGLTTEKAAELLKFNGPNCLRPPKTKSRIMVFVEHMFLGFSLLLWVGVILSIIGYTVGAMRDSDTPEDQLYIGIVILVVILITGFFGFYQESSNTSIMESFRNMIPKHADVIRAGARLVISSEDLVLGDLVLLDSGDCVPADIRLISSQGLKIDNSSITGESDPLSRTPECTDMNPLETSNLVFFGTNVVEGSGRGIVIACGDDTLMGHIAGLTSGLQAEETPIKRELRKFVHVITVLAVFMGITFFIMAMIMGYHFFDSFTYFIAIVVANVPEGLLVTMTACLTLTAKKMAKKNCLCKNLHAIETLGSTNIICSDKTGTLTQNRMTVSHMYYDGSIVDILSETYSKSSSQGFIDLCRVGILCSRSEFEPNQDHIEIIHRVVRGDASETAVLKCMEQLIGDTAKLRNAQRKIFEIPFNSTNKYQISIHVQPAESRLLLVMKGAPERIIDRCSTIFMNGKLMDLNDQAKKKLKVALLELGYMGERVLGFSDLLLPSQFNESFPYNGDKANFPSEGMRFLGFMSMIDPPRPGVPDAVAKCKTAGIKVIMVTGDHPITAMAIAKKVGIISLDNETVYDIAMRRNISVSKVSEEDSDYCKAAVITGTDLRDYTTDELSDVIQRYNEIVFARTSPQQKLQIVEAFQREKNVVTVTGDGVNDSPALKRADIGVAMGISGSDVSKEAADMIILDDNFASIVVGIEEGRLIFDNLKKSIAYMFTSNIPEMVPFMLHVLLGFPLPLSVIAILVVDVGTDLWPGISLAYEKAEADIMLRPPRDPKFDRLVSMKLLYFTNLNIGIIQACAGFSVYFFIMAEHGFLPDILFHIKEEWVSERNDLQDSYNQEWTHSERIFLERKCYAGFFLAIVITQIADCFICKTRRLSLFQQGMNNMVMNCGLVFEIVVAMFVVYCPYIHIVLGFEYVELYIITPALPFALLIFIFDEVRKFFIRKYPTGWCFKEIYF